MKPLHHILVGAMLATFAAVGHAAPLTLLQAPGSTNIKSAGSTFTYVMALPDSAENQALLSLSFAVSSNAAAQNDTISLFLDGSLQASGRAATFAVTDLDVSRYFDFTTGTLTFQLFRDVAVGGGNIKLSRTELALHSLQGVVSNNPVNEQEYGDLLISTPSTGLQVSVLRELPEPGTLALLGIGVLGMTILRRRSA